MVFMLSGTFMKLMTSHCVVLSERAVGRAADTVAEDPSPGLKGEQNDPGKKQHQGLQT